MKRLTAVFMAILLLTACELGNEGKYDPPADHTISKDGAKHKSGLTYPTENCISCHGSDLQGGTVGVSCYDCHNKKW